MDYNNIDDIKQLRDQIEAILFDIERNSPNEVSEPIYKTMYALRLEIVHRHRFLMSKSVEPPEFP